MLIGRVTKAPETKNIPEHHWHFYVMDGTKIVRFQKFKRKWVAKAHAQLALDVNEIDQLETYSLRGDLQNVRSKSNRSKIVALQEQVDLLKIQLNNERLKLFGEVL
jgi:hypothetical protein|tara:strand:- start:418 stop:735 length:318 start_codon:yes stop_codon:yes gene_type:complete